MMRPVEVPVAMVYLGKYQELGVGALDPTQTSVSNKAAVLFRGVGIFFLAMCSSHDGFAR